LSETADTNDVAVAMVGLGNIGGAMAKRLVEWPGGFTVYDLRPEAMTPFVEQGAHAASSLEEVAERAAVISLVVLTDQQVRDIVATIAPKAAPDTVIALHSTIDSDTAGELAELAAPYGVHVIDAPVSGGAMGAAEGRLAVMVGGERAAYDRVKPVFSAWATLILHMGPAGAGTQTKLARNLMTYVGYAASAEASRLAEAAGIDIGKLAAVVRHSDAITGGPSAVMVRPTTAALAADDGLRPIFEHARQLGEKDLALAVALGESLGVDLPLTRFALTDLAGSLGVPHEEKS
jgi:3-hydroxyisobutyrate dehydrogenase-like beta-hydroxyacid dehydrogenase